MAGWTCPDKEVIEWDGTIKARNSIQIGTGNSWFLGRVGLGLSTPLANLHVRDSATTITSVSSAADQLILEANGVTGMTLIGGTTSQCAIMFGDVDSQTIGRIIYDNATDDLSFWTSAIRRMTISGANIGMGTDNPQAKLHLSGATFGTSNIRLISTAGGNTNYYELGMRANSGTDYYLSFEKNGGTVMSFDTNNLVGIGTTVPANRLHVSGASSGIALTRDNVTIPSAITSGGVLWASGGELYWRGPTTLTRLAVA